MKYICKHCDPADPCRFSFEGQGDKPEYCPVDGSKSAEWKPVEIDPEDLPDQEPVEIDPEDLPEIDREDLPDWCKVGVWVFDRKIMQYSKISEEDITTYKKIVANDIAQGEIIQARMRPYNAEEMKVLVGKVLIHPRGNYLVTFFSNMSSQIKVAESLCNADELLQNWVHLDKSPCGVLEHLKNGEWVK